MSFEVFSEQDRKYQWQLHRVKLRFCKVAYYWMIVLNHTDIYLAFANLGVYAFAKLVIFLKFLYCLFFKRFLTQIGLEVNTLIKLFLLTMTLVILNIFLDPYRLFRFRSRWRWWKWAWECGKVIFTSLFLYL